MSFDVTLKCCQNDTLFTCRTEYSLRVKTVFIEVSVSEKKIFLIFNMYTLSIRGNFDEIMTVKNLEQRNAT